MGRSGRCLTEVHEIEGPIKLYINEHLLGKYHAIAHFSVETEEN